MTTDDDREEAKNARINTGIPHKTPPASRSRPPHMAKQRRSGSSSMSNAAEVFAAMAEAVGGPDGTRLRRKFKVGVELLRLYMLGGYVASPSDFALSYMLHRPSTGECCLYHIRY